MRSKIARKVLDETPAEVRIYVRKYGDIIVRVHQLLREKGWTQKDLAVSLDKTPSEISKWLNGDHNFTIKSLAKLEAELGAEIIYIPKKDSFHVQRGGYVKAAVNKVQPVPTKVQFQDAKKTPHKSTESLAA
jgi:transcriptional regulator with XRE-family HTH domain